MFKRHRSRITYWSSSKFSKWLRTKAGLEKPSALPIDGWTEHEQKCKEKAPFIHWVTDELLNKLQNIVLLPSDYIYSIKCFYKNWKGNTHVLDGKLEVGQWYDLTYRIPRCLFTELEKYIEEEKGLETLEWEFGLVYGRDWGYTEDDECFGKPTAQALAAIEQRKIYDWWKANKDRDFYKESGWSDICKDRLDDFFGPKTDEEKEKERIVLDKLRVLEEQYEKEETEMLISLIKIRGSLWS